LGPNRELAIGTFEVDARTTWAHLPRTLPRSERKPIDIAMTPRERAALIRAAAEARNTLREAAFAAAEAAARARAVADALDEALASLREVDSSPPQAPLYQRGESPPPALAWPGVPQRVDLLSPREREVLALVAEGRSNKSIAEALFVSPNTIKTHVASLLSKLHADSRVELAAIAARQQMR
jgi:DNA-binding NarL/FixJ family response regulator